MTPREKILREGLEYLTTHGKIDQPPMRAPIDAIARETLAKADAVGDGDGWISVKERLPEEGVEVLVEVDGHRGPSWRNNHNLVAYLTKGGSWVEERHGWNPLPVLAWQTLPTPYEAPK